MAMDGINTILTDLGLTHLMDGFKDNSVGPQEVLTLTDSEFNFLGVSAIGDRARLSQRCRTYLNDCETFIGNFAGERVPSKLLNEDLFSLDGYFSEIKSNPVRLYLYAKTTTIINVSRGDVLSGTKRAFSRKTFRPELGLRVKFSGENGIDDGGPSCKGPVPRFFSRILYDLIAFGSCEPKLDDIVDYQIREQIKEVFRMLVY
ncbi:uncharacterized protein LOC126815252 [Patella vulgata]|uniref:uncharacterized protein LOC126815252 n=1 Tax=Patella vulgata TaxID=6465 RepID=UPI0021802B71|nr:uncharacterized protein LOC126815252 [Patella vulgata]